MTTITTPTQSIQRQIDAYGFTDFIDAAKTQLKITDPDSADHAILDFLLKHGVGAENAKCWKQINEHLSGLGLKMPKNYFQTNMLQRSRRNTFYIGSCHKGFFLIAKQSDVDTTLAFYKGRIAKENANRDALLFLATQAKFKDA
jgi:hypothetical protein